MKYYILSAMFLLVSCGKEAPAPAPKPPVIEVKACSPAVVSKVEVRKDGLHECCKCYIACHQSSIVKFHWLPIVISVPWGKDLTEEMCKPACDRLAKQLSVVTP